MRVSPVAEPLWSSEGTDHSFTPTLVSPLLAAHAPLCARTVPVLCFCSCEKSPHGAGWWNKQSLFQSDNFHGVWWAAEEAARLLQPLGWRAAAPLRAIITFWIMCTLSPSHSFSPSISLFISNFYHLIIRENVTERRKFQVYVNHWIPCVHEK